MEMKAKTTEELLQELSETIDKKRAMELKEEIIKRNIGLVRSIAYQFLNSGEPLEDLISAGYIGLLNAVHNFDLNRGHKFTTYASYLIKGEIRHHIRDNYNLIKVPRWLGELSDKLKAAEGDFFAQKGRPPTIGELADLLNIEEEGVAEVLKARDSINYISLDQERREDDPRPIIDVAKIKSKRREGFPIEYKIRIAMAIEKLSEVQQKVVKGLFYYRKTQAEVAKELGYSQRHISRIKNESLKQIKEVLQEEDEELR
jgi:RNA polymerase sigma factor (sigma-70 family)